MNRKLSGFGVEFPCRDAWLSRGRKMAGFRASPLKPLPNRSAKSRMAEYTQQQLGTRCSGQLSIQQNVLGNLSCSALGQHVDKVASGPCPPLDGIAANLPALSCRPMPPQPADAFP